MHILKSSQQARSRITETSSERWKDRDSEDNSSQAGIIGLESSLANGAGERERDYKGGITATTRVEVRIEDAEKVNAQEKEARGRWGA